MAVISNYVSEVSEASPENEPFATDGRSGDGSSGRPGWASGDFGVSANREDDMAMCILIVCRRKIRKEAHGSLANVLSIYGSRLPLNMMVT
jgi:hypothetical protein